MQSPLLKPQEPEPRLKPEAKQAWKKVLIGVVIVLVSGILLILATGRINTQSNDVATQNQNTLTKLAKIIILPSDKPTITVISNVDNFKKDNQEFFKDAKNGDKLILYSNKAIIFREEEDLIVNAAQVTIK